MKTLWVVTAAALTLIGCQSKEAQSSADAAPKAAQPVVHGRAIYLERIAAPAGATLTVQLIDQLLVDTPAAVLASAEVDDAKGPPFEFTLPYDPGKLREGGQYGLHASLRDADGRLWFITDTRVPVTPGKSEAVEVRMIHVAGSANGADTGTTHWQCADSQLSLRYDAAATQAELSLPDGTLTLPQAVSASGARYADQRGNEFWSKGSQATLTLQGKPQVDCMQTDQASPWAQTAQRGLSFRGIGTEPGWLVEVGPGAAPALHAELDYGERSIDVPSTEAFASGYRGSTGDGVAVELQIRNETCSDGMSDQSYPTATTLVVGDRSYQGCGRYLSK